MTTKILMNGRDEFKSPTSFAKKLRDAAVVRLSRVYLGNDDEPKVVLKIERGRSTLVLTLSNGCGQPGETRVYELVRDKKVDDHEYGPIVHKVKYLDSNLPLPNGRVPK
ncbi:hypothetical protein QLQ85_10910 [Halomonas sp. M4R5S39]|uniref:hypothetical protein n=1 Tax=Halomonas kalidii TaxID=3043293 RepID=UPI0024A7DEF3|nr:hypothetical protein [Halomonas kalidii]MDI5985303.1 hypothetical protein [Halomonas kalidii]